MRASVAKEDVFEEVGLYIGLDMVLKNDEE